ncbi:hypothetical protein OG800_29775 [Streptomyces sp. NBC_00445]|uniref:trypco2 family protein n=1 Tax=Streptomyces sp. NBC_00445 TaxID=2975745 RepID=UPI002E23965A
MPERSTPVPFREAATPSPPMELADVVDAIRAQLNLARDRGRGEDLQFELGDIEIEFSVSVSRDHKADGGIKVWVLNAGGSFGQSQGTSQRLKVVLKPTDATTGRRTQVSDKADLDSTQ